MYGSKLRKRAQTLLLPYLFWNGALVGLHLLIELLFPSVLSGEAKPVLDNGWCDWWDTFWAREPSEPGGMPMPINYPLWFIRDLMVLVVFAIGVCYGTLFTAICVSAYLAFFGSFTMGPVRRV